MPKTKQLTEFDRIEVIRLNSEELSQREIARRVGCTQSSVGYTLKKYEEHKTVKDLHCSGWKRISNARD
jgi:IS30 family transposase